MTRSEWKASEPLRPGHHAVAWMIVIVSLLGMGWCLVKLIHWAATL